MKKYLSTAFSLITLLLVTHSAFAMGPFDYEIMTRNGLNTGNILTYVPYPGASTDGLLGNLGSTGLGQFFTLGSRLSINHTGNILNIDLTAQPESNITNLVSDLASKASSNPGGTTAQYVDGTGAVQTSKTLLSQFTNDAGFLTSVPAQTWASITGKPSFASVATTGAYADLSGSPTNVSAFTNDSGYVTSSALSGYALTSSLGTAAFQPTTAFATSAQGTLASTALQSITSGNVTAALGFTPYNAMNPNGYITSASIPAPLYSTYQASVTQTGTSAPTATQLANSFSGSPTFTWARTGTGTYTITASSAVFTANKTKVFFGPLNNPLAYVTATVTSTTVITVNTQLTVLLTLLTGNADALMTAMPIDVRVYP